MAPEIIIAGAGVVGLTTSLLLANAGFAVLVIDIVSPKPVKLNNSTLDFETRVSALTSESIKLFQKLNLWQAITLFRFAEFNQLKIGESGSGESDINFKAHGVIIENSILQHVLFEKILNHDNIIFKSGEFSEAISQNNTALIIGADGAQSSIRALFDFENSETHYPQLALVATIQTEFAHEFIARQRFLKTGPLAFLPLSDPHHCSIVWSIETEEAKKIHLLSDLEFNQTVKKAFQDPNLGDLSVMGKRTLLPLIKRSVKNYVKEGVVLVGDAAHTIHPLAGQGLNLGLLDAQALADVLIQSRGEGRNIRLLHTLKRYERARKTHNFLMQTFMDVFNTDYLRKPGFYLVKRCDWLKRFLPLF